MLNAVVFPDRDRRIARNPIGGRGVAEVKKLAGDKAAAKAWLDKRRSVTGYLIRDAQREDKRT